MKELYEVLLILIIRFCTNVKEAVYTHSRSIIHVSVYFVNSIYLALGISTAMADEAAFLIGEQTAAVRALPG